MPVNRGFDGETFSETLDGARLSGQLQRVRTLMLDGRWRTLDAIRTAVGGSEAGISARLRDCRKAKFGRYVVERRRVRGGLHEYRLLEPRAEGQQVVLAAVRGSGLAERA
jgi:hypothetical protein